MSSIQSARRPKWLRALPALLLLGLLAGCAGARWHMAGMQMIANGEREAGLQQLREASRANPTNAEFRIDYLRELGQYLRDVLERADEARRAGTTKRRPGTRERCKRSRAMNAAPAA
jgi:general secretion pathway protein D